MAATMPQATTTCSEVEQAWLEAGQRGDTKTMQMLLQTHPKWLAPDRVATTSTSNHVDGSDGTSSFCDWDGFYLPTVGASTLHAAAWNGNYDVLKFLLEQGQHVDEQDRRGVTALMATLLRHNVQTLRAVFHGNAVVQLNTIMDCRKEDGERLSDTLSVVRLLLLHGAGTEMRDQEGRTALFLATNDELFEIAKLLLENGALMDAQDSTGRSPLHACLRTFPEQSVLVTNLLLSRGAPIDLLDKDGETPLMIVVRRGDTTALQLFLNHHSLVATPARQDFAGAMLLQAAELGIVNTVRFLLNGSYSSIDVVNARGETALHLAILKQRKQVVEVLCASKDAELLLEVRTQGNEENVLHYAARYGAPSDLQLVLSLVRKSIAQEVNRSNAVGMTPMYLAVIAADAGSLSECQAKVAQLNKLGALLFSSNMRLFQEVKCGVGVALTAMNPAVRRALALWLLECSATSATTISEFCMDWLACVQRSHTKSKQHDSVQTQGSVEEEDYSTVNPETQAAMQGKELRRCPSILLDPTLAAVICAGYAIDAVPLLLTMPLKREAVLHFLELLKTLAKDLKHALLQKLQLELLAAWKVESDDSSRQ
uniref:Ankyrin repeat protein n=1 Tax=Peronospora matthiolae TaxID=2874970 RepID=A0AAV1U4Z4_9STRA